jgi:hypothetical protein
MSAVIESQTRLSGRRKTSPILILSQQTFGRVSFVVVPLKRMKNRRHNSEDL